MAQQHVLLMQQLGVPQAEIDKVEALKPEDLAAFKPDEITGLVKGVMKTNFLNDQEFLNAIPEEKVPAETKKKIESQQYGRFMNELRELGKKELGLEDVDFKDMTEKEKDSLKAYTKRLAEAYSTKKGSPEGLKGLQDQLRDITDKLSKKDEEWTTKLNADLDKVKGDANAKIIKALTRAELKEIEGIKFGVPVGVITDPLLASINAKYSIVMDDAGNLVIKSKANPALDVLVDNKPLTFRDALKKESLEMNIAVEDKAPPKKETKTVEVGGDENKFEVPSYIADQIKKVEAMEGK